MAYIHPTWWRPQYLGQRHDIAIDSNCDAVELKLDGHSLGKLYPSDTNAHSVVFSGVEVVRGTLVVEGTRGSEHVSSSLTLAGPPVRLVASCSADKIPADRSGIAVISVDIVDAQGLHVFDAAPPLTWEVTGAATLVGPTHYETDSRKNASMEGTMYIDAPTANVIRARAIPGDIRVKVSAPGLTSAEVTLAAVAPAADTVSGLTEPTISDEGRVPIGRDPNFMPKLLAAKAGRIDDIPHDFHFPGPAKDDYRQQIERFVREHNPGIDTFSVDYRSFIERLTEIVVEREGLMIADDYNFNARALNQKKPVKKKANPSSP
jgi:hypothetical protein